MKYFILIAVIAIAYFIWHFVVQNNPIVIMMNDSGKRVSGNIIVPIIENKLKIEIDNNEHENFIKDIKIPRSLYNEFNIKVPDGFKESPLKHEKTDDQEMIDFVDEFNKDTVRFEGNFELLPDEITTMIFLIKDDSNLKGELTFGYEHKVGFGGSSSSFSVDLNPQEEAIEKK
jgi:hypothetical protein